MHNTYIIGRKGDIYIRDNAVSRHHAQLTVSHNEVHLKDLDSANEVYLVKNGRLIRFFHGFVQLNQSVVIGSKQYTINQLLGMVGSHRAA
ncbi:MAG: FHA domain-containing protein [Gammaproteobacteria bacterium]|nr:FHA domain-containing protein [Gammaproteobacteria bacterium]